MALTSIPLVQTPDRLINQLQSNILNPLNNLISWFNTQPVSSFSSGVFTTTSSTYVNVPNLTANFTATGRPIRIELLPDGTINHISYIGMGSGGASSQMSLQIIRDTTIIATIGINVDTTGILLPPSSFNFVDDSAPVGNHIYFIQVKSYSGVNVQVVNTILRVSQE